MWQPKASRKLQREHQRYVEFFEDAPDGYVVTDLHGVIKQANFAAVELLESVRDFIIGNPLALFVHKRHKTAFYRRLNEMDALKAVKDWEVRLQPWKRKPFWASINLAKFKISEHEGISLRWLIRDITDRKRMEKELRKSNDLALVSVNVNSELILFFQTHWTINGAPLRPVIDSSCCKKV
jgi:PAS domain S-box-containing protein